MTAALAAPPNHEEIPADDDSQEVLRSAIGIPNRR